MESPQNKRASNRKKANRKVWASPAWKAAVKEFTKGKVCQWCGGTESLTAHHPYQSSYGNDTYINLYLSGCLCLCKSCHFSIHHNLILCPVCKSHYMRLGADMCYGCYILKHPEVKEAIEAAKERKKRAQREYAKKKREELKAYRLKKAQELSANKTKPRSNNNKTP
jgi:hypothetical protein